MRVSKLLGALFLVSGFFVFTRGTSWHVGYMVVGAFLGLFGLLLVSRRKVARLRVKPMRAPVAARPGRVRLSPATTK